MSGETAAANYSQIRRVLMTCKSHPKDGDSITQSDWVCGESLVMVKGFKTAVQLGLVYLQPGGNSTWLNFILMLKF